MMCLKYRNILLIVIKNPWKYYSYIYILLRGAAPTPLGRLRPPAGLLATFGGSHIENLTRSASTASPSSEEHKGTISIAGRTITNLRFADAIDVLAGSEQELAQLVERIDQTSRAYGIEIIAEKTKLMTNNINGIHKEIKASGQKLQNVTNFKYLGAIISDAGSKADILSRIAQCTTTMTRLKPIWNDRNITLGSKVRLMRTLVISILLYACETWTLTIELQRRIKAVEMRCYRRLLHMSYKDHITNEIVCTKIQTAIGPYEDLLTTVEKGSYDGTDT